MLQSVITFSTSSSNAHCTPSLVFALASMNSMWYFRANRRPSSRVTSRRSCQYQPVPILANNHHQCHHLFLQYMSRLQKYSTEHSVVRLTYAVLTCEIKWNKIISKLFQPSSTSIWNNFISARGNLPEIISELFHTLIAPHEYFPTCSLSVKLFWNNFRTPSAAEIILFQFQSHCL